MGMYRGSRRNEELPAQRSRGGSCKAFRQVARSALANICRMQVVWPGKTGLSDVPGCANQAARAACAVFPSGAASARGEHVSAHRGQIAADGGLYLVAPAVEAWVLWRESPMGFPVVPAVLLVTLLAIPGSAHAMWVKLTDTELIARSDVIVIGELIGQTRMKRSSDGETLWLGILEIGEVLKGDPSQTMLLLVLPSPEGPRSSSDIFYRKGQRGLWFLHTRRPGEIGLYLADHPQRFLPAPDATDRIKAIRKILKSEGGGS